MSTEPKASSATEDAGLREIESLVAAVPLEKPPIPATAPEEPDLEQVARDLGITVEEVRALREAKLG